MPADGLKLAARYAYRPFLLGFCGPQDKASHRMLTHFLLGGKEERKKIRAVFQQFIGAYPYYTFIAWRNKIKDPLDYRVVEAYWLGNSLLHRIHRHDMVRLVNAVFVQSGFIAPKKARDVLSKIPEGALPHHSFHVLFLGSVTETVELKGKALDFCRIAWGLVKNIDEDKVEVEYRPLILQPKPRLGALIRRTINYERNFGQEIAVGDIVSFHWNFVCDKISSRQAELLEKYTLYHLKHVKHD